MATATNVETWQVEEIEQYLRIAFPGQRWRHVRELDMEEFQILEDRQVMATLRIRHDWLDQRPGIWALRYDLERGRIAQRMRDALLRLVELG
jgi:hypothetical protein